MHRGTCLRSAGIEQTPLEEITTVTPNLPIGSSRWFQIRHIAGLR
jgi:hypothetical protein